MFLHQAVHLLGREQQGRRGLFEKAERIWKEVPVLHSRQGRRNRKEWSPTVVSIRECVDGEVQESCANYRQLENPESECRKRDGYGHGFEKRR